uniref:26S proteasome non-ATPase regulatory subunit 4-like n=1 Tax=Ciona intestinalis TaxID=7719 RepID=UPI000180CB55|nr:26S proteasome non-ATPase regulatory subunit 4-like [Ciona intestinalis]|eukprot:XP_002126849.1 26S proteasome non-ATPase regulatory subunit 4-like [Ciona intestinalis]
MVLESTVLCIDNSEFMRNGDYLPTRIQAQQDAANMICRTKLRSNPENNVALLSMADTQVHVTLTTDSGKLLSKLNLIQPKGEMKLLNGLRVAHLALKHRQSKNHKTRIVAFIGSPIQEDEKEIIKVAKKLKKEKVSVDVINFGEQDCNTDKLISFINTLNGKDGAGSHLVTIPPGSMLSGAIGSSPIVVEEGSMSSGAQEFDMGFDPNADPELALALRVSLEEQRHRQEEEARRSKNETQSAPATAGGGEETMLDDPPATAPAAPTGEVDIAMMTEDEQIAYALTMSMQATPEDSVPQTPMETESAAGYQGQIEGDSEDDDDDVIADPDYLQSVLESLPGVNPNSEAVQQAMTEFTQRKDGEKKDDSSKKDGK